MQITLVDKIIVPEESKATFLERAHQVQRFIKTLPGFVEGFLYEKEAGESAHNFMTTAVWESEEAFQNAQRLVAAEYQNQGFNPQEFRKQLRITSERDVYKRSAY